MRAGAGVIGSDADGAYAFPSGTAGYCTVLMKANVVADLNQDSERCLARQLELSGNASYWRCGSRVVLMSRSVRFTP